MRRRLVNKNVRKVFKKSGSYCLTIPIEIIRELKVREGQKLVVKKRGSRIVIEDWKAKSA
jgi:antitoxin component of MazEF toxin-antitoxin module